MECPLNINSLLRTLREIGDKMKILFLSFVMLLSEFVSAGSVQVRVDPQEGVLGDHFNLSITVSGSAGKVELPPIPEVNVVSSGTSTSISYMNGTLTKETTYNYVLEPQKEGTYTLPSFKIKIDDKMVDSNPVTLTVKAAGGPPPPNAGKRPQQRSNPSNNDEDSNPKEESSRVYIEREFSKTTAYEGEPIVVTTKIFHKIPLSDVQNLTEKAVGVRTVDIGQYESVENGMNVLILKQTFIPLRKGKISIPAFRIRATMLVEGEKGRARRNNPFDDFFEDFLNGARNRFVKRVITGKEVDLNIKSVPLQGKPSHYKDLVGTFRIDSELNHSELKAGDTATLSVVIDGVGPLDTLGNLDLSLNPDIRVYPDKPQSQEKPSEKYGIESKRIFKFALVPIHKGEYKLGVLKVPYFDPVKNSYQEMSTDLGVLKVAEGDVSNAVVASHLATGTATSTRTDVKALGTDLIDIKRHVSLSEHGNLRFKDLLLLIFFVGLPGILSLLLVFFRTFTRYSKGKYSSKKKQAWRNFEQSLKKLEKNGLTQELENFYSLYREFLGDKLNLKGRALTAREISSELNRLKISQDLRSELESFAKTMEETQYAAHDVKDDQKLVLIDKMKMLARELEKQC